MDQSIYGGRVPPRRSSDPQLPTYMHSQRSSNGHTYSSQSRSTQSRSSSARSASSSGRSTTVRSSQRPGSPQRPHSGGSGGNGGNRSRKKRPSKAQKFLRAALIILALLLVVVAIIVFTGKQEVKPTEAQLATKTYFEGITIEGVSMEGKTIEQARGLLQNMVAKELSAISVTIPGDGESWTLTANDMNVTSNMEDILLEAMAFGRSGTLSESSENKETLKQTGKDFSITYTPDRAAVRQRLGDMAISLNTIAVEPQLSASLGEDNKPIFDLQEGIDGRKLNVDATADLIMECVAQGNYPGSIDPVFDVIKPTQDTEALRANTQFIASYTTRFRNSSTPPVPNRVFNIRKAADIINGLVLQPGEEWSFNGYVGLRTVEGGWKEANGISGGKEYTLQAGGGICQVSTTLYNALLSGNIEIVYRQKHSIPSDYVGYGLDATVDSGGIDFNFRNSTNAPLYVFVYVTKDKDSSRYLNVTVDLYGEPLPEGVTYKPRSEIIEQIPRDDTQYVDDATIPYGYQLTKVVAHDRIVAEAYQDKYVNGERVESKLLNKDTYRGNPAEIHVGVGDPATVPVPEGAVPATVQPTIVPGFAPANPNSSSSSSVENQIPELES